MTKDKVEFAWAMGRHSTATLWHIQRLMRTAATLQRLAIEHCNRELSELEQMKQSRATKRIHALCAEIGVKATTYGDPRGCVVKIQVPDGYTNDFGNEGICVPAGRAS